MLPKYQIVAIIPLLVNVIGFSRVIHFVILAKSFLQHKLLEKSVHLKKDILLQRVNGNIWSRKKSIMIKTAYVTYSLATLG